MNIRKALIIDDDPGICLLIEQILKFRLIDPVSTPTLEKAREIISVLQPDLIFIDHRLPDGAGINFIPEIRKMVPDARIIAMTAEYEAEKNINILGNGADYFLEKPFMMDDINKLLDY